MSIKSNGSKTNGKSMPTVVAVKSVMNPVIKPVVQTVSQTVNQAINAVVNEDEDLNHDYWHPTSDQLGKFVKADIKHATSNLVQAMSGRGEMSMRDLKEVLLHSIDVIERALVSMIASGKVKEHKGRYQLAVLS